MAKEHQSEDQRILAMEQIIPGIQQSLDRLSDKVNSLQFNGGSSVGLDFIQPRNRLLDAALFEQSLSILRTLYLLPSPPPPDTRFEEGIRVGVLKGEEFEFLATPGLETEVCFYIEVEVDQGSMLQVILTTRSSTMTVNVDPFKPKLIKGSYVSVKIKGVGDPGPGDGTQRNVGIIRPC